MFLYTIFIFLLASLVPADYPAQYNLLTVLSSQQSITTFAGLVGRFPTLLNQAAVGNFTVLAPSDNAFVKYFNSGSSVENDTETFAALLSYHILQGVHAGSGLRGLPLFIPTLLTDENYANVTGGQCVEVISSGSNVYFVSAVKARSKLSISDIIYGGALGGIIHVIDTVLTMPIDGPSISTQAGLHGAIQVASVAGTDPQLLGSLGPSSDWTMFAPNRANIPIEGLSLQNLYDIEAYHFVHSTVAYSPDFKGGMKLQTVQGEDVTIALQNGTIYINAAKIIDANYLISNGILHLIDVTLNSNDTSARHSPLTTVSRSTSGVSPSVFRSDAKIGIGVGTAIAAVAVLVSLWWYMRVRTAPALRQRKATTLPELGPRENEMTAELYDTLHVQVHEIGEGRMIPELCGNSRTDAYEIGVAL